MSREVHTLNIHVLESEPTLKQNSKAHHICLQGEVDSEQDLNLLRSPVTAKTRAYALIGTLDSCSGCDLYNFPSVNFVQNWKERRC